MRKKEYTEQSELDFRSLGERWGCTFTNFVNMFEHDLRIKADEIELDQFVGGAFRRCFVDMANYKHHDYGTDNELKPPEGWDEKANPEWHYYVKLRLHLYAHGVKVWKKKVDHMKYHIGLMKTQYGGIHYVLIAPLDEMINPDPSLEGSITEIRPMIY